MKNIFFTLAIAVTFLASCSSGNLKEPEFRDFTNARIIEMGLLQSTAGIDLIYYNPNNFGVQLNEARGDVYVDNAYLGRFGLEEKVQVGKKAEFIVPAIIKLDMIGAIKNQREIYKKKEVLIRIEGMALLKKAGFTREVPIKYEKLQNIEKLRSLVVN